MLDADLLTFLAVSKPNNRKKSQRMKYTKSVSGPGQPCIPSSKAPLAIITDFLNRQHIRRQNLHDTCDIRRRQKLVLLPHAVVGAIVERLRHRAVCQFQDSNKRLQTTASRTCLIQKQSVEMGAHTGGTEPCHHELILAPDVTGSPPGAPQS